MYEALDAFLAVETWDSLRSEDEERFFRALDRIVRRPGVQRRKDGRLPRAKIFQEVRTQGRC